ncbi:MAG: hypothetical protein F7C38_06035 [Desulfurococcales archaeon]|nr:hypothetical protein [Desulfurococcales archaeon]
MSLLGLINRVLGNRWVGLAIFTGAFYLTFTTLQDFLKKTPAASTGVHLLEALSTIVYVAGAVLVVRYIK